MTVIDPRIAQALAIRHALRLYAATGLKANTSYTPSNMLRTAGKITGRTYPRGHYAEAAADLLAWCEAQTLGGQIGRELGKLL